MRLAFVTPRYGAEITRGAEHICRLIAEHVADRHEVEVLTTRARSAETGRNEYPDGADRIRGVLVRRFTAAGRRGGEALPAPAGRPQTAPQARANERQWLGQSGSGSPGITDFLRQHHQAYEAVVFFSHCAGTTLEGLGVAPDRSVLFPCAAVEPSLRLSVCQDALTRPAAIGYLASAERRIVRAYAPGAPRVEEIVGIGVEPTPEATYPRQEPDAGDDDETTESNGPVALDGTLPHLAGRGVLFRRRRRLHGRFVLHAGAVEPDNGAEELIEYFDAYAAGDAEATLVLMGVKMMKLQPEPWLQLAGVLAERDRMAALEAAAVAVAPDPHDVAGERVLESLGVGTPVLASARSPAAVEHCRRSNGGLYYRNREEFVEGLRLIMSDDRLRAAMGRNGRQYVQQHYRWEAVLGRFERLISRARHRKA